MQPNKSLTMTSGDQVGRSPLPKERKAEESNTDSALTVVSSLHILHLTPQVCLKRNIV